MRGRTRTPLAMALRGTFLVGGRPAADDLVRRFVLCAAESGIDIFRMHDPLNDIDDLAVPAAAVREAGARLYAGLVYSDGPEGHDYLLEHARRLSDMGADRILLHDPAGALDPAGCRRADPQADRGRRRARRPLRAGAGRDRAGRRDRGRARGRRPDRDRVLPGRDADDRAQRRSCSARRSSGLGFDAGLDRDAAWDAAREIEAALGDAAASAPPVSPHVALRAALATVPIGVVAGIERSLRAAGAEDRLDEVLDELLLRARRERLSAARLAGRPHPRRPGHPPRAARAPLDRGRRRHAQPAARRVGPRARARSIAIGARRRRARARLDGRRAVARGGARGGRQPGRLRGGPVPRRAVRRARAAAAAAPARPRGRHWTTRIRSTTTRRGACAASCGCSRSPTRAS